MVIGVLIWMLIGSLFHYIIITKAKQEELQNIKSSILLFVCLVLWPILVVAAIKGIIEGIKEVRDEQSKK